MNGGFAWDCFCKPEYLFRPVAALRRIKRYGRPPSEASIYLPWGCRIRVRPRESLSAAIWKTGLHDLVLTEAVWRLLDADETAVDVGANIGYVSSLMAARVGDHGQVICLEPHPVLFGELESNVQNWRTVDSFGKITALNLAASSRTGTGFLGVPADFATHRGGAHVVPTGHLDDCVSIKLATLDTLICEGSHIGLLKIDVEGHELEVLKGTSHLMARGAIRDIIFEDYGAYPTPVMALLEACGYKLFFLGKGLLGPRLLPPDAKRASRWTSPNYLATIDADRALGRLRPLGWAVFARSSEDFYRRAR